MGGKTTRNVACRINTPTRNINHTHIDLSLMVKHHIQLAGGWIWIDLKQLNSLGSLSRYSNQLLLHKDIFSFRHTPGESGEIQVSFSTRTFKGKVGKSIRVETIPPVHGLNLTIHANIVPEIYLNPGLGESNKPIEKHEIQTYKLQKSKLASILQKWNDALKKEWQESGERGTGLTNARGTLAYYEWRKKKIVDIRNKAQQNDANRN